MEVIKVTVDWLENYGAVSDSVPGCVATHKTIEGVKEAYLSALKFHLEGLSDDEKPEQLKGEYELKFELTTRAILYELDGILTRSTLSRVSGINEQQLRHYMSGHRKARADKREKLTLAINEITRKLNSLI